MNDKNQPFINIYKYTINVTNYTHARYHPNLALEHTTLTTTIYSLRKMSFSNNFTT